MVGCAKANNIAALVVLRFFAGMFGSPPVAVGGGTTADLSTPANRGVMLTFIALVGLLGPTIGFEKSL